MIGGGALYAVAYPVMKANIIGFGNFGKINLPALLGVNHWIVIFSFAVITVLMFAIFEKKRL
jgi:hypothetical protein